MNFLFDFDGTIADTLSLSIRLYNELAPKYKTQTVDTVLASKLRDLSAAEIFARSGLSPLKLPFFVAEIQAAMTKQLGTVAIFPDLKSVLLTLKKAGHTLGIVTSNSAENVQQFLTTQELTGLFTVIAAEKNFWGKGAKLSQVIQRQNFKLSETYYIGDEVKDISAARTAQIPIISVTWGFNSVTALSKLQPDFIVTEPAELLALINSLSKSPS
jgi:phosphoglycolate phosphatase-like HAD superfamily hydrolase